MNAITNHEWCTWLGRRIVGGMNAHRRAIIAGGGIAGPALAIFLARAGIEPVVLEAHPLSDDVGGGFQIAPNGLRVLAALGIADDVIQAGHPSRDFCFKNHRGETIGVARTAMSGPAANVARAPLHRILRAAAAREGVTIRYEKRLAGIDEDGDRVVVTLEDGTTETGDFLIGADGVHSRVRAWMLPEHARPRDTQMVSLGAFCSAAFAPDVAPEDHGRLTFIVGPKHQFGYSKMSATQWGWWCHVAVANDDERAELLTMPSDRLRDRMLERYSGWCAPVAALIDGSETWLRTSIHDVPRLPVWHRGRVALIGDAAHAMSPAGGQGASLALEDAMLLGMLVAERTRSIEETFARFERIRRSRAEAIVAQGYSNDRRTLKELGAFEMWMRDALLMRLAAPLIARALNRVYAGEPALAASRGVAAE